MSWVTPGLIAAAEPGTNVLHAGGYARVAITALIKARLLSNRYVKNLRYDRPPIKGHASRHALDRIGAAGPTANKCLLNRGVGERGKIGRRTGGPLESARNAPGELDPLPELRLEDFVDVHPDPPNAALIDLDLVQTRGGMGESLGRAPVVLPEVRAQAVVHRPVDRL